MEFRNQNPSLYNPKISKCPYGTKFATLFRAVTRQIKLVFTRKNLSCAKMAAHGGGGASEHNGFHDLKSIECLPGSTLFRLSHPTVEGGVNCFTKAASQKVLQN